jgi:hypothetical protein
MLQSFKITRYIKPSLQLMSLEGQRLTKFRGRDCTTRSMSMSERVKLSHLLPSQ